RAPWCGDRLYTAYRYLSRFGRSRSKAQPDAPAGGQAVAARHLELATGPGTVVVDGARVGPAVVAGPGRAAIAGARELPVAAPVDHQPRMAQPNQVAARDGDRVVGVPAAGRTGAAVERSFPARTCALAGGHLQATGGGLAALAARSAPDAAAAGTLGVAGEREPAGMERKRAQMSRARERVVKRPPPGLGGCARGRLSGAWIGAQSVGGQRKVECAHLGGREKQVAQAVGRGQMRLQTHRRQLAAAVTVGRVVEAPIRQVARGRTF